MDLHNNLKVTQLLNDETPTATAAGNISTAIDRSGFGSLEFLIDYGVWTTTGADFTVRVEESDSSSTGFTSVADTDLLGTEASAGVAAAATVADQVTKKIGYIGKKRYVRVVVVADTATGSLSVIALQGNPIKAPQA